MIDLHTHSLHSDGSDSPERVVELAAAAGCQALALTDHDTLSGIPLARARADEMGIELIAGVELSCHTTTRNVHILGYFLQADDILLNERLVSQQMMREERNERLAQRLNEIDISIDLAEVIELAGHRSVGRPHFAAVLMRHGYVDSIDEAFLRFLGDGAPAYVERQELPAATAIQWITDAGGVAAWAHPYPRGSSSLSSIEPVLEELASYGLVAIEARYSRYDSAQRRGLCKLAERHQLIATGGSDYHGTFKPDLAIGKGLGDLSVPYTVILELRSRLPN